MEGFLINTILDLTIQMGAITVTVSILCIPTPAFWSSIFHNNFYANIYNYCTYKLYS